MAEKIEVALQLKCFFVQTIAKKKTQRKVESGMGEKGERQMIRIRMLYIYNTFLCRERTPPQNNRIILFFYFVVVAVAVFVLLIRFNTNTHAMPKKNVTSS